MTSKEQRDIIEEFMEVFPRAYTVEDTMRLCLRMKEDIERLRAQLRESCPTCGFYREGIEPNE